MKCLMDIGLGLSTMIVLVIVTFLVYIAIVLEDGLPFFVQERTGINGKTFRIYKFQSMCNNARQMHFYILDENDLVGTAFKMKDDPRITKVGGFLRKTSLDELSQLLNILKDEMSIVGL